MACSSDSDCSIRDESIYDVVIVGFGPAALSIAAGFHEQKNRISKVLILERDFASSWRGKDLPSGRSRMRTNLIQDIVAARNPQSQFTFINYLWATNNLVGYTNLGLLNPPRELFDMYLGWCAKHFDELGWTRYGQEVVAVEPETGSSSSINKFRIKLRDVVNSSTDSVLAKKVIIAPGSSRHIPEALRSQTLRDKIFHVTGSPVVQSLAQSPDQCLNIAVVGVDDEAVEVLEHCLSQDWRARVTLFTSGGSVQQTDKNPFAGNAILASKTTAFEVLDRQHGHARTQPSIQPDILSDLYSKYYTQLVKPPTSLKSNFEIQQFSRIISAERAGDKVAMQLQSTIDHSITTSEPFDIVFVTSAHGNGPHEKLVEPLKSHFDDRAGKISLDAGYRVNLRHVDREAGVWMLGGYGSGGGGDAFSYMALRAARVLESIAACDEVATKGFENVARKDNVHRAAL